MKKTICEQENCTRTKDNQCMIKVDFTRGILRGTWEMIIQTLPSSPLLPPQPKKKMWWTRKIGSYIMQHRTINSPKNMLRFFQLFFFSLFSIFIKMPFGLARKIDFVKYYPGLIQLIYFASFNRTTCDQFVKRLIAFFICSCCLTKKKMFYWLIRHIYFIDIKSLGDGI